MYDMNDIRAIFSYRLQHKEFVTLPSGVKTIEIAPACFLADEPTIFGEPNDDYIARELAWYDSQSLNVNDIPGGPPAIWKKVATPQGVINSNYGWAIWSEKNGKQYESVLAELKKDPTSRRGVMIYTRPTMHVDQNADGMQDFMCLRGDTIVLSPEGDLPIKEVVALIKRHGRWPVLSVNFSTGKREFAWAIRGEHTGKKKIVRVHLDDGTFIDSTSDHRFYVRTRKNSGRKFSYVYEEVSASDLKPNQSLVSSMMFELNGYKRFKKTINENHKVILVEELDIEDDVYDIEVEGNHNFFVGSGVLVHNCTNTVQYLVRGAALDAVVSMRSNDAYHGYRNDWAWQSKVQNSLASDLGVAVGNIYWCAGSLHFYESHFHHVVPEYHLL